MCIIHQNKTGSKWITFLLLNIVTISLNSNVPPLNESMYPCLVKFCQLFFEPLYHSNFHFFVTCIMLGNWYPLLWGRRDSGEYGRCGKVVHSNKAIVSLILMLVCGRALSCIRRTLSIGKLGSIRWILALSLIRLSVYGSEFIVSHLV